MARTFRFTELCRSEDGGSGVEVKKLSLSYKAYLRKLGPDKDHLAISALAQLRFRSPRV